MDLAQLTDLVHLFEEAEKKAEEAKPPTTTSVPIPNPPLAPTSSAPHIESDFGLGFKCPEYDFKYRQSVSAAEVYGAFGGLTPSLADSQYLILTIALPGERPADVDLDITEKTLTLYAKHHRLHMELPHPVNDKKIKAKFTGTKLEITLERTDIIPV
ncbi:pre-RNA processing PIH1/Nop17 family protein [Giardia muris]|uniref:Pre-RNA processing PIH1/Nop17 family protein n=1 Tax=Giardia muris TaxID=5742 RepID=A0A4Z1SPY1_GIAMU|nr:pre-RNA processing PIH1/Nop17 family protein [Giardia muris]|eukprot:TNJ27892.1 pre-RNA processing PIH1/Nop17 family protein [Giardia muris]